MHQRKSIRVPNYLRGIKGGASKYVRKAIPLFEECLDVLDRLATIKEIEERTSNWSRHHVDADQLNEAPQFIRYCIKSFQSLTGKTGDVSKMPYFDGGALFRIFATAYADHLRSNVHLLGQFDFPDSPEGYVSSVLLSEAHQKITRKHHHTKIFQTVAALSFLANMTKERSKAQLKLIPTGEAEAVAKNILDLACNCADDYLRLIIGEDLQRRLCELPYIDPMYMIRGRGDAPRRKKKVVA